MNFPFEIDRRPPGSPRVVTPRPRQRQRTNDAKPPPPQLPAPANQEFGP